MKLVTVPRVRLEEAVSVLCDAFSDYPVMRYVLGWPHDRYEAHLRKMIDFFTLTRFLNQDVVLGVEGADESLGAVANITRPGSEAAPEVAGRREALWRELGADARERYEELGPVVAAARDRRAALSPEHDWRRPGRFVERERRGSCSTRCIQCQLQTRARAA